MIDRRAYVKELFVNEGVKTIIYSVKDLARAKALYRELLGVEPYGDQPYYVGFKVGGQDISLAALLAAGRRQGRTSGMLAGAS